LRWWFGGNQDRIYRGEAFHLLAAELHDEMLDDDMTVADPSSSA